jgi:hypothetical protein
MDKTVRPGSLKEDHEAEGRPNGVVGSHNQYGRYGSGRNTLNERSILEEDGSKEATPPTEQPERIL